MVCRFTQQALIPEPTKSIVKLAVYQAKSSGVSRRTPPRTISHGAGYRHALAVIPTKSTQEISMKKLVLSAILLMTAASAFASERPCRVYRYHHHHRYCAHR